MRIQKSRVMRANNCSGHQQSMGFLSLVAFATLMTFFVSNGQPINCGPEIITYGDCPHGAGQQLPYRIQTPLPPPSPPTPIAPYKPHQIKSYGYDIDGVEDPHQQPSPSFAQLPVRIQEPILPPSADPSVPAAYRDPLRGKSYGIGIQPGPVASHNSPSLGQYDFGVQNSVPAANRPAPTGPLGPYRDPLAVEVQPAAVPNQESPLWGTLPIGIERPIESRNAPGNAGPRPVPLLKGLTSNIDKLLLPVNCPLPMDGSEGGPSQGAYPGANGPFGGSGYSGGNGPFGGSGYSGGNGPLGGSGYSGGNGPLGGSGYPGGNGPLGGSGYSGANGPLGGSGYSGGNGPFGGSGYSGGNGPLGGSGYSAGNGHFGGGGYTGNGFSSCG